MIIVVKPASVKIYCRETKLDGTTEEWKEIGESIMGEDYSPGEDVMVEFPVDMEYLREYRIKAVSCKDEESKFSRIIPVKRDHVSGEFYLEALYPIYTYEIPHRWSEANGAPGYVIESKEKETDKWENIGKFMIGVAHPSMQRNFVPRKYILSES